MAREEVGTPEKKLSWNQGNTSGRKMCPAGAKPVELKDGSKVVELGGQISWVTFDESSVM